MIETPQPSPNFNTRRGKITAIVIHTTGGSCDGAIEWFARPDAKVSSHVVISKTGQVYRCVDDKDRAWHAGFSTLHQVPDCNDYSLGVELERLPDEIGPYPDAQLEAAAQWCAEKCNEYQIPLNRIVGHHDIAVPLGRKSDPANFEWVDFLLEVSARWGR